jgi:small subunit ribosomal protein S1
MSESFAELFEESLKTVDMQPGSIVTGVVIDIDNEWVTVHAGLKSEGVIPRSQFIDASGECTLSVGDEVQVALETVEDGFGETKLSREKAKRAEVWKELEAAFAAEEVVKGVINGKVKGGFTVDVNSIRAFLPGSLVDVRPVRDTLISKARSLSSRSSSSTRSAITWSCPAARSWKRQTAHEREALLANLQEGQSIKGVVKNLTDYGAFVDLGGVDGLLHITDMAWKRIKHPSEIVEVGQELEVKVLKFDRERNRVSLGLKQLGDDPWVEITGRYPRAAASWPRSRTSRITAALRRSKRAWKVLSTSRRWTGRTRTCTRPRSCNSATRSR